MENIDFIDLALKFLPSATAGFLCLYLLPEDILNENLTLSNQTL